MVSQSSSAAVQRQMQAIRGNLAAHADEAVSRARTKFDWRHYVAGYPWASLGAAVATGYFLAPRRTSAKSSEPRTAPPGQVARAWRPSLVSDVLAGMISAAAAIVTREGLTFVTHSLKELLEPCDEALEKPETVSRAGAQAGQ